MLSRQITIGQPILKPCETLGGKHVLGEERRNSRPVLAGWARILALYYWHKELVIRLLVIQFRGNRASDFNFDF